MATGQTIAAHGRPPTRELTRQRARGGRDRYVVSKSRNLYDPIAAKRRGRRYVQVGSEPGLAEKAIDLASEALDTDLKEVLETVQCTTADAVHSTQDALQETAAAVGVTAAADTFMGLSGPIRAMILLNIGSALFGGNQVAMKVLEGSMSPSAIYAFRFLIAFAFFLPAAARGFKIPALRWAGAELGAWLFGGYVLQGFGLEKTSAAHSSFTGTIMVLVVPVLVGLSGRKVSNTTWIASVVALFGVALLTTSDASPNYGDGLCILSAILYGVHKWKSELFTVKFQENTQELVAMQLGMLAVSANLFALPELFKLVGDSPEQLWSMFTGLPWPLLFWMGSATTAFTLWVEINALKDVPATLASLLYSSEPLWGALFAWTLLGEHWGPTGWVGAFLIISSTVTAQLKTGEAEEIPEEERPDVHVEVFDTSLE